MEYGLTIGSSSCGIGSPIVTPVRCSYSRDDQFVDCSFSVSAVSRPRFNFALFGSDLQPLLLEVLMSAVVSREQSGEKRRRRSVAEWSDIVVERALPN